jgi:glycosyltransferase involved in cell wall biosynthesis
MTLPKVYFDVSTLINNPIKDGIRRATLEMLKALTSAYSHEQGLCVIPISFLDLRARRCYLPVLTIGEKEGYTPLDGEEVQWGANDILFIPAYDVFVPELHFNFQHLPASVPVISVVYDLLPIIEPTWFPKTSTLRFDLALKKQLFYSDVIVVNSQKVKKDLLKYCSGDHYVTEDKDVKVLKLSGLMKEKINSNLTEQHHLRRQEDEHRIKILMVGTIEPRKGHRELLEILIHKMSELKVEVTIVGRLGWKVDVEKRLMRRLSQQFPSKFKWIQNASDEDLNQIYLNSDLYLAASLDEGYGLPVVEALSRTLPVLARNIEVFEEVSNGATATFGENGDFLSMEEALHNIDKVICLAKTRVDNFVILEESEFVSEIVSIVLNSSKNIIQ